MSKPHILVARAIFPEVIERLAQHFEVQTNQADEIWSKERLIEQLRGKDGVFTTGGERIDAQVLQACPTLKICANMAVGYNNFDVPAASARPASSVRSRRCGARWPSSARSRSRPWSRSARRACW